MSFSDASKLLLLVALIGFMGASQLAAVNAASYNPTYQIKTDTLGSEAKRAITRLRSSRDTITVTKGESSGRDNKYGTQLGSNG